MVEQVLRLFYVWALILNGRGDAVGPIVDGFTPEMRDTLATATEMFPRFLAQGFALAGMAGPAIRWLKVAVDRGFINYPFLAAHDPFFQGLRDDPRWEALLGIVRDRWERFEA